MLSGHAGLSHKSFGVANPEPALVGHRRSATYLRQIIRTFARRRNVED